MENLIENAKWNLKKESVPLNFKATSNINFDNFQLFGCRTASLTMKDGIASQSFDDFIDVSGKKSLMFGLTIKADDVDEMFYVIEYFDNKKRPITVGTKNITPNISPDYQDIFVKAEIPSKTAYIKIRWDFKGNVSGARFFDPRLFAE